jgi:hypothetical protein
METFALLGFENLECVVRIAFIATVAIEPTRIGIAAKSRNSASVIA